MENRPTISNKRIEVLDIYRGFAILGIFVVNIIAMNSTYFNQDVFAKQWTSGIDLITNRILQLFFYTKFFPIFSLLFGLGISMQALKLKKTGQLTYAFFFRRMFLLFVFGVCHIVFLWSGDVLNLYAVLGLLTTFFISKSNKLIIAVAAIFLFFPFYDQILAFFLEMVHFKPENFLNGYTGESVNEIIKNGTYIEGLKLRVLEYFSNIPMLFGFLAPIALSMFLLGLYLGKNKIFETFNSFLKQIKKPILTIAIVTNIYRLAFLFILPDYEIYSNETYKGLFVKLMVVSDVMMGLFYLWLLGWFWTNSKYNFILKPLKYVGRMALTNYIMQSVIGLFLFSSVGLKWYETLNPFKTFVLAIIVFIIQVLYSKIWLSYFQYGPLEWVWRCFTYRKMFPIKKETKQI